MTQKRILIIQHIDIETPGIILNFMKEKRISFDCRKVENDNTNLLDYDGLIIMGGPMSVNDKDRYSFIDKEIELVKHYLMIHKPILGICLGSQIIASALNSSIYRNSKQELGWHNISLTQNDNTIFENLENNFLAFHWHGDIFDLPNNSIKLASSQISNIQAFVFQKNCYGLLFHLEVTKEIVENIVDTFKSDLVSESIDKSIILSDLEKKIKMINDNGKIIFNRWLDLI
jgi:GMP synthase-like glutamine amidotransferase